ncbi:MAG: endonuclease III domain-containing protein [Fastidiosipilaceae bacterium]|jgi:endonuclease-3 related protein
MADRLKLIYQKLLAYYGAPDWWPARTPYEVMVGAVLTQNTAWSNVELAIRNFGDELSAQTVRDIEIEDLKQIIRPSGFYNQKAIYLKAVTDWYGGYDFDVSAVQSEPLPKLRTELLSTKGVGPETADSILLYAFDFPVFVVDAYTVRLCGRYPLETGRGYEAVRSYFENNLERDRRLYNEFHALIVIHAKEHCRKKAICAGCPLTETCLKQGV